MNFQNITSDHKSRNAMSKFIRFFIYYIFNKITPSLFFFELFVFVFFNFWVYFSFSGLCLPNIQPGLCSIQRVFCLSHFLNDVFWFDNGKPTVSHFFSIWCSNLAFQCVSMATSVLHCITSICTLMILFMHSSLTNRKLGNLLSI